MKYLYLLAGSLVVATPAWAQNSADSSNEIWSYDDVPSPKSDEITVTATGLSTRITQSGQSISVLTADDLAQVQGPDLTRAIEQLPGVTFARSGGLGSQTALFVRGANSEQLLVMIDGIRVEDQAAPSGVFDPGTLLSGGIGRVELLRGSNSLAWGSEAIGGVLAIDSDARPGVRASAEYGAHNSVDLESTLGLADHGGKYAFGLNAGYLSTDGISAYAPGTETDPFRQWQVGGRGSLTLAEGLKLVAAGRYADSKVNFDGFPPPLYVFADTPEYQVTRQGSGRVGLEYDGSGLTLSGGVALSDTRRSYFDNAASTAPNYSTAGRGVHADLKGRADLTDTLALDFGADGDWSRFSSLFDPQQSARTIGAHALLGYHGERLNLTAGGRFDDHDRFGTHWTFGANGSFSLSDDWRLRASWGEGFKAPTLYQLYGFGGNTALQPETSQAFDAGIEYGGPNASGHFALTLFRRDSTNLIDYVFPSGYFNVNRARAEGIELDGDVAITPQFKVRASYSYIESTNRISGKRLPRRPRNSASVSADWTTPLAGLALGADLRLVGDSFNNASNTVSIDGYGLLTLRANVPLGQHLELFGRIENVTDTRYETVTGYGTYGRSAYAGVRVKW